MANNLGKKFETSWKDSFDKTNFFYLRLRDAAKWTQGQETRFQTTNPADSIAHSMPYIFLLELKSVAQESISFMPFSDETTPWSKPKGMKDKNIKTNQVKELMKFAKKDATIAGFIFNFRERKLKTKSHPNEVFFVHVNDLVDYARETGKSSISREDCREIGVSVEGTIKKVNYTYDIKSFVTDCITMCLRKKHLDLQQLLNLIEWIRDMEKLVGEE